MNKPMLKRTQFILFTVISCFVLAILFVLYYVMSISWNRSVVQFKQDFFKDQTYEAAYVIALTMEDGPLSEAGRIRLDDTVKQFAPAVRYYSAGGEVLFDSASRQIRTSDPYVVKVPVVDGGRARGYLEAYFALDRNVDIPYLFHLDNEDRQMLMIAIVVLSLLVSWYIAGRLSRPIKASGKLAEAIAGGDRESVIPSKGSYELVQLTDTINGLLSEFNRQEEWRKQLMQDLTHELRTPLTSVLSRLDMMLEGFYPFTQDNLQKIYAEIDRLYRLIDDMKKLSEAEGARFQLHVERVNMTQLTREVFEGFLFMAEDKKIKYSFQFPNMPCYADVDPDRMIQVLSNLISNAIKYTQENGKIEVGLHSSPDETVLYCSDDGIGISENDLPYVFHRFFRADKSRSRESGGLGVGLSIAKALAEAHGGTIEAVSELGKGSKFYVRLPAGK